MKKELELKLVEKYPNLFKDYGGDMTKTCMHWGFAHGDGWYDLIDELSSKLEPHGIVAAQVKEKLGGLRFYIKYPHHLSDEKVAEIRDMKNEYQSKSYEICEDCGKPGELCRKGWLRTLCKECEVEFYDHEN